MAELNADDLPESVLAKFADTDAAQFALDAALAGARHYCGWPVSPVETVTVTVDDVGHTLLGLPTMKLIGLISVTELGAPVDVSGLRWGGSNGQPKRVVIERQQGCWSRRYGAITVTMEHGFTEAEAADWRYAVTQLVDTMSYSLSRDPSMVREKVGEVETQWADRLISTDERLSQLFSAYRILPAP